MRAMMLLAAATSASAAATTCTIAPGGVPIPMNWVPYIRTSRLANSNYTMALEVGSYDGSDAAAAARQAGVQVHVFEPSPKNFARCVGRFPQATQPLLHFHQVAATDVEGTVEFFDDGSTGAGLGRPSTATEGLGSVVRVPAQRLDSAPQLARVRRHIGVVKIDVQGHEAAVLNGMEKWLRYHAHRPHKIILEFDPCLMSEAAGNASHGPLHTPTSAVAMLEKLDAAGYDVQLGSPYPGEVWYWAYADLAMKGALKAPPCTSHETCAALIKQQAPAKLHNILTFPSEKILGGMLHSMDKQRVNAQRDRYMLGARSVSCKDAAEFFCPPGVAAVQQRLHLKAMYTDLIATRRAS